MPKSGNARSRVSTYLTIHISGGRRENSPQKGNKPLQRAQYTTKRSNAATQAAYATASAGANSADSHSLLRNGSYNIDWRHMVLKQQFCLILSSSFLGWRMEADRHNLTMSDHGTGSCHTARSLWELEKMINYFVLKLCKFNGWYWCLYMFIMTTIIDDCNRTMGIA